jgi:hypothetical protein
VNALNYAQSFGRTALAGLDDGCDCETKKRFGAGFVQDWQISGFETADLDASRTAAKRHIPRRAHSDAGNTTIMPTGWKY